MGYIVNPGPDAAWDPGVFHINKLTPEICAKDGYEYSRAAKQFFLWYQDADAVVAHNGTRMEKPFVNVWGDRFGYDPQPDKLWIDTSTDIPFPDKMSRHLTYLAADHNFLNPFPHTALFDVMTMLVILDQYPLDEVIRLAKSPSIAVKALVSYDDRELAKARGYRAEYNDKGKFMHWRLIIKECFLERERNEAGFPIEIIP
jgi:DNA polymerase-3 subunit epsilon